MSKRPGNIARFITNLKNSYFNAQVTSKYIGADQFGNEYYEKIGDSNRNIRGQRFIKEKPGNSDEFIPDVPVEWDAWLRGRRKNAPTEEEIYRNEMKQMQTRLRAQKLEGKFEETPEIESEQPNSSKLTETIVSNNLKTPFPRYEDYEDTPGQKYNKEHNTIK